MHRATWTPTENPTGNEARGGRVGVVFSSLALSSPQFRVCFWVFLLSPPAVEVEV